MSVSVSFLINIHNFSAAVDGHYRDFNIYKGLDCVMCQLRQTNAFVQTHKPWELKKSPEHQQHLDNVLHVAMETLRVAAILLQPVVPNLASRILDRLGVKEGCRSWRDLEGAGFVTSSRRLGEEQGPLFPRIK